VRAEATLAEKRGSLVPVMIEPCDLPIMFQLTHTVDLGHWQGTPEDAAWRALLADVRRFVEERSQGAEPVDADQRATSRAAAVSSTSSAAVEKLPSIAVLPFANMSGDKEQEYFSDGLAEEIINALAQIAGLKVIARTSAFTFKGQNTDIRRIAETLGVANILEGSVDVISGNRKDCRVLQRGEEREVQDRRQDGQRSRVLSRGLSCDQITGRLPVDIDAESSWRFPAGYREH
jgi:TolB-like protein